MLYTFYSKTQKQYYTKLLQSRKGHAGRNLRVLIVWLKHTALLGESKFLNFVIERLYTFFNKRTVYDLLISMMMTMMITRYNQSDSIISIRHSGGRAHGVLATPGAA